MNEFVERFIQEHIPSEEGKDWLRDAAPSSMDDLWEKLLDTEQNEYLDAATRVNWSIWCISATTQGTHILAELTWRFASEVYDSMSDLSRGGMDKVRRFLDGDLTIDIKKAKRGLWNAVQDTRGATRDAAQAAAGAADAADAENSAPYVAVWAARAAADEQSAHKRQLEIIRQVLVEKGNKS
jgi:hypothetical protein